MTNVQRWILLWQKQIIDKHEPGAAPASPQGCRTSQIITVGGAHRGQPLTPRSPR